MHATDLNKDNKKKAVEAVSPACSYPLEVLMALQKMLENGFPEAPATLPRPAARNAEKPLAPAFRVQSDANHLNTSSQWRTKLRLWLMKLRKSHEADKGHSAQQTG